MRFRLGTTVLLTSAVALATVQGVPGAHADGSTPGNLSHLAAINHMSAAKLGDILAHDKTAHLDHTGHMFYVEPAPTAPVKSTGPQRARSSTAFSNVSVVPALSSRPSSTHKIFLDFNGTTVSAGSAWAGTGAGKVPAGTVITGFSLDSDPSTYTPAEVSYIQTVWKIVSEKYSPYDVDVTTIDPGTAGYSRSTSADANYGDHVVITDDPTPVNDICSGQCAGVAYVGTFDVTGNAPYDPVWVFSSMDYGSAQLAAHDAAHEVGHTFGLSHDGTNNQGAGSYYDGQNNWVPIMGITNQNAIAQFSKGEYPDANNQEDDLAIIGANGNSGADGSLLLPDDYPNTGFAPDALGSESSYGLNGIISNAADDDLFSIARTCTTDLTATATGIGAGQSVDLKVDILDTSNNVLASDDPTSGEFFDNTLNADTPTGMDASATLPSPSAGTTYRVRVSGVGSAANGYTNYASIGQYHLTITGCPAALPSAPATASATPNPGTTTGAVNWTAPTSDGGGTITGYTVSGLPGNPVTLGNVLTYHPTNLVPGTTYNVTVAAINSAGTGPTASTSLEVDTWAPTTKPVLTVTASGRTVSLHWTAPANPGHATLTGWHIAGTGPGNTTSTNLAPSPLAMTYSNVPIGTQTYVVTGQYAAADTSGISPSDPKSVAVAIKPGAPRIGIASSGARGGLKTATARWYAPTTTGGAAITSYRVVAYQVNSAGRVIRTITSKALSSSGRLFSWTLPGGRYKFRVVAYNRIGVSPYSGYSRLVTSR
ncbi:MAG: hypothetical protein JWR52_3602 [Marmoricola sp.]|nr:hypothetical protein [Marmoricola sp.]